MCLFNLRLLVVASVVLVLFGVHGFVWRCVVLVYRLWFCFVGFNECMVGSGFGWFNSVVVRISLCLLGADLALAFWVW